MDLATYLKNATTAARQETLKNSDQLTLGELILKLKHIKQRKHNPEPMVVYDFCGLFPTNILSWRGAYDELALNFIDLDEVIKPMKLSDFIDMLLLADGGIFAGYKGGEFVMSKHTPVWVANWGNVGSTAVVDVVDDGYQVILITGYREY